MTHPMPLGSRACTDGMKMERVWFGNTTIEDLTASADVAAMLAG